MNKPLTWFLQICIIFCLAACSESTFELSHVKRIVLRDAESFTLWYSDSADSQELKAYESNCANIDVQIVMDAAPEKDMWATMYRYAFSCFGEHRLTLHIHSAEEINGGGSR